MSIMTNGGGIKPMPGYEDAVKASEASQSANFNDLIGDFLENREVNIEYKEIIVPADPKPEPEKEEEEVVVPKEREIIVVTEQVTVLEKEEQESTLGVIVLLTCLLVLIFGVIIISAVILIRSRRTKQPGIKLTDIETLNIKDKPEQLRVKNQHEANDTQVEIENAEGKQFHMSKKLDEEWIGGVIGSRKRKNVDDLVSHHSGLTIEQEGGDSIKTLTPKPVSEHIEENENTRSFNTSTKLPLIKLGLPAIEIDEVDQSYTSSN